MESGWAYALIWFLVNDRVKLLAYRILDPAKKAKEAHQPSARSSACGCVGSDVRLVCGCRTRRSTTRGAGGS